MRITWIAHAGLLALVFGPWPVLGAAEPEAFAVVQDRIYRVGGYLVVDALVENRSAEQLDLAEVSVEFYNFFDRLLRAGHTVLRPSTLGPGQAATLEVVVPPSHIDPIRTLRYRFTWQRAGGLQVQQVLKRDVWAIGRATRDP